MTTEEIINEIKYHFDRNVKISMLNQVDEKGNTILKGSIIIEFEIRNDKPIESELLYLKIESIQQAKDIFKGVIVFTTEERVNEYFDKIIPTLNVDYSKELYFTMFYRK